MTNAIRRIFPALFLCVSLFLTSCGNLISDHNHYDNDEKNRDEKNSYVEYDARSEEYVICGKRWTNLFEYSQSPNQRYIIYVASQFNGDPEIWLYDENIDRHKRITRNDYAMESEARVDDNGNWTCVLTELSFSNTLLLYNGQSVGPSGLNRSPCFRGDGKLFFACYHTADNVTDLCLYTPTDKTLDIIASVPYATGASVCTDDGTIFMEAYDPARNISAILRVFPDSGEVTEITDGVGNYFLTVENGDPVITRIDGDANALYLANAYYWIYDYQNTEPWSGANDYSGRISWNESYRLQGEAELYEKTLDPALKSRISDSVKKLMASRKTAYLETGSRQYSFLFSSKKYSIDRQSEITLMVDNAMIYWAMTRCANAGCLSEEDKADLIEMAKELYLYYEDDWDADAGLYRFRKGIDFWADGSVMPFNQQNAFGLFLLELYKATGEKIYLDRCTALARTFAAELEITEDGQTIWHYWPWKYYRGWEEWENVSEHTPSLAPIENPGYEDTGHALLNALFIRRYAEIAGYIFSPEILDGIRNMIDHICTEQGDSSYLYPAILEKTGLNDHWAIWLNDIEENLVLSSRLFLTDNFSTVEFDTQRRLWVFASAFEPKKGGELRVTRYHSQTGQEPLIFDQSALSLDEIPDFIRSITDMAAFP